MGRGHEELGHLRCSRGRDLVPPRSSRLAIAPSFVRKHLCFQKTCSARPLAIREGDTASKDPHSPIVLLALLLLKSLSKAGVTAQAWHLLAIFLATIVGIITQPLPLGAVAVLGLGATMLTKVLTFGAAFSAFASEIP